MAESMIYYTFIWRFQKFSLFLQKKFIMSDYGTDGYNETA